MLFFFPTSPGFITVLPSFPGSSTNACDLIDETQCKLSLSFGDRSYTLAYRNTCWVTTVLRRSKSECTHFSIAVWNSDCARKAGIHREKHKDTKGTECTRYFLIIQFVQLGLALPALDAHSLGTEDAHTAPDELQTSGPVSHEWEPHRHAARCPFWHHGPASPAEAARCQPALRGDITVPSEFSRERC